MEQQEKQMIDELFGKLKQAEAQTGAREAGAESYIHNVVAAQPNAPYYMAQAILVQEHALNNLNQRVQELEQELKNRPSGGGGFLGGLFGAGSGGNQPAAAARSPATAAGPGPFQNARQGSFLGGAMQTAMGVAGGMLLANAMMGMFAGDTAEAATMDEPMPEEPAPEAEESGGWGDDFGGMDDDF